MKDGEGCGCHIHTQNWSSVQAKCKEAFHTQLNLWCEKTGAGIQVTERERGMQTTKGCISQELKREMGKD